MTKKEYLLRAITQQFSNPFLCQVFMSWALHVYILGRAKLDGLWGTFCPILMAYIEILKCRTLWDAAVGKTWSLS